MRHEMAALDAVFASIRAIQKKARPVVRVVAHPRLRRHVRYPGDTPAGAGCQIQIWQHNIIPEAALLGAAMLKTCYGRERCLNKRPKIIRSCVMRSSSFSLQ